MRRICLLNQKGGVGKTTSTINLGAALARLGRTVLLVDLDPQAHLSVSLGIPVENLRHTVGDLLLQKGNIWRTVVRRGAMDILPSSVNLAGIEIELASVRRRELRLRELFEQIPDAYDFILIDCPPSLGLLGVNALAAVQEVFVPVQAEFLALQSLSRVVQAATALRKRLNPQLRITGILATRVDGRRRLNTEAREKIREHFGRVMFRTCIRENIALAEAPGHGKTIFEYRPSSYGAEDYMKLAREVVRRGERWLTSRK